MLASGMATQPAIIVHGGAASWPEPARREAALAGCVAAAQAGAAVLARGDSALDAVEAAVRALEADETFNAGYGAVLNRDGGVEHDALIVDGALRAGAVGALVGFRHPVSVARHVLERGEHVFLVGDGARAFAREVGLREEPLAALISPRARARHAGAADTVGACAVDRTGGIAAATSTGGIAGKRAGRVGDSPIIGAGAFADDRLCAVSATGHGEPIMRVGLSRTVAERVRRGDALEAACRFALTTLRERTTGQAGLIVVAPDGRVAHATSTPQMPWASVVDCGETSKIESGIEP
jgi:beta-aspartyl-peptidase (threonine type)